MMAYAFTFQKIYDFVSIVSVIEKDKLADTQKGSSYAFYHDRKGKYLVHKIVSAIIGQIRTYLLIK